jgi:hypothetical protein
MLFNKTVAVYTDNENRTQAIHTNTPLQIVKEAVIYNYH